MKAIFMLNEGLLICVDATEIHHNDEFINAWNDDKMVAILKTSEVIGCWLDGVMPIVRE